MDQRLGLRTVLEDGDLAKFAKLEPTVEERLMDFERVRDFVLATKPEEGELAEKAPAKESGRGARAPKAL
jgi:hypothetical protein